MWCFGYKRRLKLSLRSAAVWNNRGVVVVVAAVVEFGWSRSGNCVFEFAACKIHLSCTEQLYLTCLCAVVLRLWICVLPAVSCFWSRSTRLESNLIKFESNRIKSNRIESNRTESNRSIYSFRNSSPLAFFVACVFSWLCFQSRSLIKNNFLGIYAALFWARHLRLPRRNESNGNLKEFEFARNGFTRRCMWKCLWPTTRPCLASGYGRASPGRTPW